MVHKSIFKFSLSSHSSNKLSLLQNLSIFSKATDVVFIILDFASDATVVVTFDATAVPDLSKTVQLSTSCVFTALD